MSSSDRLHKHAVLRVKIGRSGGAMVSHVRGRRLAVELGLLASRLRGLAIEGESFDSRCALAQDIRRETACHERARRFAVNQAMWRVEWNSGPTRCHRWAGKTMARSLRCPSTRPSGSLRAFDVRRPALRLALCARSGPALSEPDGSPEADRQVSRMVRKERFELSRSCERQPLKLLKLVGTCRRR